MEDVKVKAKKSVLEEIMKLMEEGEVEGLKAKSPKFAKVEVEAEAEPMSEEKPELEAEMSEDMDDEDKARLQELYEKYC